MKPVETPHDPNIPTNSELGYPRFDATSCLTLAAPGKMAPAAIQKLSEAISRSLNGAESPAVIEKGAPNIRH
jgi:tripartite-type tricarboxylate transporter receptor subunit TctC